MLTSSILMMTAATTIIRKFDSGVKNLLKWVAKLNSGSREELDDPAAMNFSELEALGDSMALAIRKQRDMAALALKIEQEQAQILSIVSEALSGLKIYSVLYDREREQVFSNVHSLAADMPFAILAAPPKNRADTIARMEAAGIQVGDSSVPQNHDDTDIDNSFSLQISVGDRSWIYQTISIKDGSTLLAMTEVTTVRDLERRLAQSEQLEALGRISAGVSHEFNNMLNIILSGIEEILLSPGLSRISELRERLAPILRAGEHAAAVTKEMKQLSHVKTITSEYLDLTEWSKTARHFFSAITGPHVEINFSHSGDFAINVDPAKFDMAIVNLCKNASEVMEEHGRIDIDISLASEAEKHKHRLQSPDEEHVMISISDTGPGIDPEIGSRVFEPFFTSKSRAKGSGLGLATVYGYCAAGGGSIRLDEKPTNSSKFNILFPRAPIVAESHGLVQKAPRHANLDGTVILILEDEVALASIFDRMLSGLGASCKVFHTLSDAEEFLREYDKQIDAAVIDKSLPDGIGLSIIPVLQKKYANIYCICLSGEATDEIAFEFGANSHLTKPVSLSALSTEIAGGILQSTVNVRGGRGN